MKSSRCSFMALSREFYVQDLEAFKLKVDFLVKVENIPNAWSAMHNCLAPLLCSGRFVSPHKDRMADKETITSFSAVSRPIQSSVLPAGINVPHPQFLGICRSCPAMYDTAFGAALGKAKACHPQCLLFKSMMTAASLCLSSSHH